MRKHAFVAGGAAVGIGLAIAMMGVSPAVAGPVRVHGLATSVVSVTATVPADDTGEADATCAAGDLLVGGGYVVNSTSTDWRIYVDAPLNGTTWLVEPVNFSAQPLSFSAYAICATGGKKLASRYTTQVVYTTVHAPTHETAEADAVCPAGELRTGGGYDVYNVSANWSVYSNSPLSSDTWNVEIDNEVPLTTTFHSYAICLAKKNATPIRGLTVSTVHTAPTAAVRRVRERGAPEDHVAKWVAMENVKRVGRREFLKGAGTAAGIAVAGLAGGVVFEPRRASAATSKQPVIAIVGGGLAGLRAAHVLWTKYGWTSTIYEASSRVGGRCETQRNYWNNGLVAEMHGEFISSEHASMLNLVKLFNLTLDDTRAYASGTVDTYWVSGARYTQAQLNADWQAWGWTLFNNAIQAAPWPQSYNSYTATGYQWDQMSVPQWMDQYMPGGASGSFGGVCLQNVIDEYGGDPADQSALNLTMILGYYDSANGRGYQPKGSPYLAGTDERWHVTGGNDQIVTGMVSQLPAGTIQTGQVLVALKANADGTCTLTFTSGSSTKQVTVDSVILALPFTALRNVDLSQAGLSPLKMTAINNLGMGTNAKIIMQFNSEPWITDGFTGTTYQDNGFISSGWQMVQSAASGGYTGPTALWTAFPGGNYTQDIITAYKLTQDSGVPPSKLVRDTLTQLEPVLPGVTTAYNGLAWYDFGLLDPYLQGGYSYWRVGQYTSFSGYEGVQEGRIHFAGEHTCQDFQGYMEGAVLSGERCASEAQPKG